MFGLDYLISPYEKDNFISDQYGKKAILFPGDEDKFSNLFNWDDINHLIEFGQTENRSARLVFEKNDLGPSQFPRQGHWINEGATYVINHLQRKDAVIERLASILGAELNTTVNINTYISAKSKQAFDTHYDKHDVFIVQIYGTKEWTVFNPTTNHPLQYMGKKEQPPKADPYLETALTPGDVLYIPRGHWHHALASNSTVHLTVGHDARSPIDFLSWFIEQEMWENEKFRQNFPLADSAKFMGSRDPSELDLFLNDFREQLIDRLSGDQFEELFTEFVMASNHMTSHPKVLLPNQFLLKDNIAMETEFELPIGQKIILKHDSEKNAGVIYGRGVKIRIQGASQALLSAIFHHDANSISGHSVKTRCPDMKDDEITRTLLKLVEEGVIQVKRNN